MKKVKNALTRNQESSKITHTRLLAICSVLLALLVACKTDTESTKKKAQAKVVIEFKDGNAKTVQITKSIYEVNATLKQGKGTITYKSENKAIAVVDEHGKVTFKQPGKVDIIASVGGVSKKFTLTLADVPNEAVKPAPSTLSAAKRTKITIEQVVGHTYELKTGTPSEVTLDNKKDPMELSSTKAMSGIEIEATRTGETGSKAKVVSEKIEFFETSVIKPEPNVKSVAWGTTITIPKAHGHSYTYKGTNPTEVTFDKTKDPMELSSTKAIGGVIIVARNTKLPTETKPAESDAIEFFEPNAVKPVPSSRSEAWGTTITIPKAYEHTYALKTLVDGVTLTDTTNPMELRATKVATNIIIVATNTKLPAGASTKTAESDEITFIRKREGTTLAFTTQEVTRSRIDRTYTQAVTKVEVAGDGGAITYSIEDAVDKTYAEINASTGEVAIKKKSGDPAGKDITITATKAVTDNYEAQTATYKLTIAPPTWKAVSTYGWSLTTQVTAGIRADAWAEDSLWTWGDNENGVLGLGASDTADKEVPTKVGDKKWKKVGVGNKYMVGIDNANKLWSWGLNDKGQLGLNNTTHQNKPTQVGSNDNWKEIAVGKAHVLALDQSDKLYSWGYHIFGQLGLGNETGTTTIKDANAPTPVPNPSGVVAKDWTFTSIGVGANHSLGVQTGGHLWTWGSNQFGQLGNNKRNTNGSENKSSPEKIGSGWEAVYNGGYDSIGLKTDENLWQWGGTRRSDPVIPVSKFTNVKWKIVVANFSNTKLYGGIKTGDAKSLLMWGSNNNGQLGVGDTTGRSTPTQVAGKWDAVAVGIIHSMGIKEDGTLWAWGYNITNRLGIGATTDGAGTATNQLVPALVE